MPKTVPLNENYDMADHLYQWPNPTQTTDQPKHYVGGDRLAYPEKRDKVLYLLEAWIESEARKADINTQVAIVGNKWGNRSIALKSVLAKIKELNQ